MVGGIICVFHVYEKVETVRFDNELIKFTGSGVSIDGFTARNLAKRGIISVSQCKYCGKVKHVKTEF